MMTMRTPFIRVFALAALLVRAPSLFAQELTAHLQMLTQGEIRNGGVTSPDNQDPDVQDHSNFIVGRARLNLDFQRKGLEIKVAPQYTGIWGQRGFGSFHMYEAWARYTLPAGLFVQLGRQALSYDDQRIIGPNDWAMAAVSHDVLKLGYEGHGHKAHFLFAYNQNPENTEGGTAYVDGSQPYKTMQTVWYHYDEPHTGLGASLLFMNMGVQADESLTAVRLTSYQQLIGTHLTLQREWGNLSASYYHQLGKNFQLVPIDAWMAAAKAVVHPSKGLSLTAGYDYLSGDPYFAVTDGQDMGLVYRDKIRGFSCLYGSTHKFYGMMDFFYVSTYYHGFSPGLQNAYGGASFTFREKLSLGATYHYMAITTNINRMNKTLGHCVDLSASYHFTKDISLEAGFSYMKGTDTMIRLKRQKGDSGLSWAWLTLIFNPRILNIKQ